jgi:hypothetical protein
MVVLAVTGGKSMLPTENVTVSPERNENSPFALVLPELEAVR